MKITRFFFLIFIFFFSGCDSSAPELHASITISENHNIQSKQSVDGDCYNKNPIEMPFLVIYMFTRAIPLMQLQEN
jgi:hypothetical protein